MLRRFFGALAETPEAFRRYLLRCVHHRFDGVDGRPDAVGEEQVFPALRKLHLAGAYYEPPVLLEALKRQLKLDLRVVEVEDLAISQRMLSHGVRGSIAVVPDRNYGELWVPSGLDPEELAGIMYHELAHLVAAHPLPVQQPGAEPDRWRFWLPRKRFSARRPPFDLARCERDPELRAQMLRWCESDADLWADHLRTFGAYGPKAYFRDKTLLDFKEPGDG